MRMLALFLTAAALALAALPQARAAAPPAGLGACPVTIHVSHAGAYSLSNCMGARKTSERRFRADLMAMLKQEPQGKHLVVFDAEPRASFLATMNAMNWAQDDGVFDFWVLDEVGRPAFAIRMPPVTIRIEPRPPGATAEDMEKAAAAAPRRPRFISVDVRADHLIDVALPVAPIKPEGLALAKPDPDPDHRGWYEAKGVRIEDLPLLLPPGNDIDMARVGSDGQGADKVIWQDVRGVYRALSGGGWGRLISEDPNFI